LGRQKPSKFWRDFAQLHISIANISRTDEDIDKWKTALLPALPPTCEEKKVVNFGSQTKKL